MRGLVGLLSRLLGFLVLLAVVVGAWGFVEGRTMDVEHHLGAVPGLPVGLDGRSVAVMSDLHVGMWLDNPDVIERMVDRVLKGRPAAVLLAGDFVHNPDPSQIEEDLATVQRLLRPLTAADLPTFAVLGEHDLGTHGEIGGRVRRALEDIGIDVLHNEAVRLRGGGNLYIVGIAPADEARPDDAFAAVPTGAPRIVLIHDPAALADLPAGSAPFAVAGHEHGGQMTLPGTPSGTWLSALWTDAADAPGWRGADGNRVYVSRGVGFRVLPFRFFAPPELTWISLTGVDEVAQELGLARP